MASGVAFYIMLASIPGIAAVVTVYGLISNPDEVKAASSLLGAFLPPAAADMLSSQLSRIVAAQEHGSASMLASSAWFVVLLWSANRGMKSFVNALNTIYDRSEERGYFERTAVTLMFTLGAIIILASLLAGLLLLPAVFKAVGMADDTLSIVNFLRWPAFLVLAGVAVAALYRYGPSRRAAGWRSILKGSSVGAVLWVGFSLLFSWYVATFGNFTALYGSLAAIVAFMFWLWLSALAVLIGAEVDASAAKRTEGP